MYVISCNIIEYTYTLLYIHKLTKYPVKVLEILTLSLGFDIHMSVHRKYNSNYNQQDATFLDLVISTDALHISGRSSAHHQEHTTVHTASGTVKQYCCLLLSWMRWNCVTSHPRYQLFWLTVPEAVCTVMCS